MAQVINKPVGDNYRRIISHLGLFCLSCLVSPHKIKLGNFVQQNGLYSNSGFRSIYYLPKKKLFLAYVS